MNALLATGVLCDALMCPISEVGGRIIKAKSVWCVFEFAYVVPACMYMCMCVVQKMCLPSCVCACRCVCLPACLLVFECVWVILFTPWSCTLSTVPLCLCIVCCTENCDVCVLCVVIILSSLCLSGEYKESQEWFMTREVQDVRVVSPILHTCVPMNWGGAWCSVMWPAQCSSPRGLHPKPFFCL